MAGGGGGGGGAGGRGQPTGIRLSEVHMGMANLTQLPSWKVEDLEMSDKRSAILKNFQ